MRSLTGFVAWVTGAGTGIGEAASLALASEGVRVALTGRREAPLAEVRDRIVAAGGEAMVAAGDASDREAMAAIADRIEREWGRLDVLFNNHGTNTTPRRWSDAAYEEWDRIIDVNVKGAYNCAGAVLPMMRKAGGGLIITTSSWAGRFYSAVAGPAYGASKHAVMALNATLNTEEGANGIRATALCPAEVSTPILDHRPVKVPDADRAQLIQPSDMGEIVVFLAKTDTRVSLTEITIAPRVQRVRQPGET